MVDFPYQKKRGNGQTTIKWLLLTLLFPVVSIVLLVMIFYSFQDSKDLSAGVLISSCAVGTVNAVSFYMIHRIEIATDKEKETELLKHQIALQSNSFNSLEHNYRLQRKSIHEFERHLQVLTDLLAANEVDTAKTYLTQLQTSHSLQVFSVNSHHPVIDVILNQKHQWALEHGIQMHIEVSDLSKVSIPTDSLVVVLSNLLDNAIEACTKLTEGREIVCRLIAEDNLFISIKNTSAPVEVTNGEIHTTKEDGRNHGYGVPAVRYVLEQLKGDYAFEYRNGWFLFVAELPIA